MAPKINVKRGEYLKKKEIEASLFLVKKEMKLPAKIFENVA